jgi:hypothetical protein
VRKKTKINKEAITPPLCLEDNLRHTETQEQKRKPGKRRSQWHSL